MNYKFLLYFSYSYALPIGEPLERVILSRGHEVVWFGDTEEGRKALKDKANTLNSIQEVIAYKPDVVLCMTNMVADFITGLKVQIFHGFNAEKRPSHKDGFSHFRIRGFFDLYCTQGPSTTDTFRSQQKKMPHFEVVETGWPKMDPLFPLGENKTNSTPTVLIASTFTERLSLAYRNDVFEAIKALSQTGTYRFLLVLHPKMPTEIKEKWKTLENEHLTYFDTTDLIPLFKQADIMFADTTSAIHEFGLQHKPVVAFNHTFPRPYLININSSDEIEIAFQKALSNPKEIMDSLTVYNDALHPYYDGKSSERVIDTCIEFLHKDKSYLKSKPCNIIRKFKVRKQLGYYTLKSYNKPYTVPKP